MNKTLLAFIGIGLGTVAFQTSNVWLPRVKAFIENDIAPPKFLGIQGLPKFNNGILRLIPKFSFTNNTVIPITVDRVIAKVFRLDEGQWILVGRTSPLEEIKITLPEKVRFRER